MSKEYNDNYMELQLALKHENNLMELELVRHAVQTQLSAGKPTLEKTAANLELTPRTLQRRLAEYGLTYTQLLNEVRFMIARKLIICQEKVGVIATKLGYANTSSFSRAFTHWTGMLPKDYRKHFSNGSNAGRKQFRR